MCDSKAPLLPVFKKHESARGERPRRPPPPTSCLYTRRSCQKALPVPPLTGGARKERPPTLAFTREQSTIWTCKENQSLTKAEFCVFRNVFGARRTRTHRKTCAEFLGRCCATFAAVAPLNFDDAVRCALTIRAKIDETRASLRRFRRTFRVRHARRERKMGQEACGMYCTACVT